MASFSVSDAALTGFRVAREQPKVIAVWAALYLLVQVLTGLCMVTGGGEAMNDLLAMSQASRPDPAAVMALYGKLLPLYGVILLILIPFYAISMTAAYRVVLQPAQSAFGYVRLGAAELRQLAVIVVLGIVLFIAYMVAATVAIVVAVGVGAGLAAAGLPAILAGIISFLIGVPLFLAMWAPFAVKLSLAGPQTLAEGRIRMFESWALTKGQFWNMLGAYVLAYILAIVVTLLGLVIAFGLAAALGGGMQGIGLVAKPNLSSIAAYFSPVMIVYLVLMSIISAMGLAITLTPAAAIYRDIAGPSSRDLAETFSD